MIGRHGRRRESIKIVYCALFRKGYAETPLYRTIVNRRHLPLPLAVQNRFQLSGKIGRAHV